MKRDVVLWASQSLPLTAEHEKWKPPPYLSPWAKPQRPFHTWAVDLIVGLKPPGPGGETVLIVGVCCFTKWVEAAMLGSKSSADTAWWLHKDIVCRFGVPALVRCDLGREFMGEFAEYCSQMGITLAPVTRANPRANG